LPTIAIAFTNGAVKPLEEKEGVKKDKIHRLCKIMDCEDNVVFTNAMELHYIDMKAFAEAVNKANSISIDDTVETMFTKWLSVITQKEINNKEIIENACSEEEIFMAVSALAKQSEDKVIRQAYQRRKDEIYFNDMNVKKAEHLQAENEQLRKENEKLLALLAKK